MTDIRRLEVRNLVKYEDACVYKEVVLADSACRFYHITENNIDIAAEIHSISWKESHKSFCSKEFVELHTKERQKQYIEKEIKLGKQKDCFYKGESYGNFKG